MGFGKFLLGGVCAVGAVIAAPVVAPMALAAGATVAGAAAAAGTAVTGAAAAAGTALASTAVGSAAVGAMTAVGTTVGSAAGAVGLTSVAAVAQTAAGATALGTIASSTTVGVVSAASGAGKIKEATETKELAERRYNKARGEFDKAEASANNELENLGRLKLEIWAGFQRFLDAFRKIQNLEDLEELELDEALFLDKNELEEVTVLAIRAGDLMKGGIASIAGGNLIGLATSAGITSLASASTGAAIGTLHGAAATSASLAALGGGTLANGGLGMAGGAVVSQGLVFAPMLAIGGMFLHSKGKKSLEDARATEEEVNKLIIQMEDGEKELSKLQDLSITVSGALHKYKDIYDKKVRWLEGLVREDNDFLHYTKEEKYGIFVTGQVASILKDLTLAKLLSEVAENQKVYIEKEKLEKTINDCDEKWGWLGVC